MKKKPRIIGGGVLLGASTILLHESIGWVVGRMYDWLIELNWRTIATLPWASILAATGMIAGIVIIGTSLKREKPAPPAPDPIPNLSKDVRTILRNIRLERQKSRSSHNRNIHAVCHSIIGCLFSFEKLGFAVPELPDEDWRLLMIFEAYGSSMLALMDRGHAEEAKAESDEIKKMAEQVGANATFYGFFLLNH